MLKIAQGIDVMPLMMAIQRHPMLWGENPIRTEMPDSPHVDAEDVLLRFETVAAAPGDPDLLARMNAAPMEFQPAWYELPEVKQLIMPMLARVGAYELGRVILAKLRPGRAILPHADTTGAYAGIKDMARHHLVINGAPGNQFHVEQESAQMLTGELWLIDNRRNHSALNGSADDRIHLIVDARIAP